MTDTDAIIISACVIVLALYAAWLWDEAKNAIPYPNDAENQNKGAQAHETTPNEKYQATKQKCSRRHENEPQRANNHRD